MIGRLFLMASILRPAGGDVKRGPPRQEALRTTGSCARAAIALIVSPKSVKNEARMKKTIMAAGILAVAAMAAAQTPAFLKGPFDEALSQAAKQNKLILVDFHQKGG
jgi:hypothetical protein